MSKKNAIQKKSISRKLKMVSDHPSLEDMTRLIAQIRAFLVSAGYPAELVAAHERLLQTFKANIEDAQRLFLLAEKRGVQSEGLITKARELIRSAAEAKAHILDVGAEAETAVKVLASIANERPDLVRRHMERHLASLN